MGLKTGEERRAYDSDWRAKNRGKRAEANRRYRERNRDPETPQRYRLKQGDRRGRLVALEKGGKKNGHTQWKFQCDCGSEHVARGDHVHAGLIFSCGCFKSEHAGQHNLTHGHTARGASDEYRIWRNMIKRCEDPASIAFCLYGAAGIAVCERWHHFPNFLKDMGLRPSSEHSIDRYPNGAGNYEPTNCRWATPAEQNRNRKNTIWVEVDGERLSLAEACEKYAVKYASAYAFLRAGRSVDHIFRRRIGQ